MTYTVFCGVRNVTNLLTSNQILCNLSITLKLRIYLAANDIIAVYEACFAIFISWRQLEVYNAQGKQQQERVQS